MFKRFQGNPILGPQMQEPWESLAAFNGCPVSNGKKTHLLYRAVAIDHSSSIGYAESDDGYHFKKRRQLIKPEFDWEKYGCEDPRITKVGQNYYIFYTALSTFPFSADGIKVGLAITKDFKNLKKYPVTTFNAKAMALFPEKINGKYVAILTADTDRPPAKVGLAHFKSVNEMTSREYWDEWYSTIDDHRLVLERSSSDHVEIGAPPIKTKDGWLLIYSYIKNYFSPPATFGIEAVMLDLKNPHKIISRTTEPLLVPEAEYELKGMVPNIAFPSGAILKNDHIHLYYGGADTVCAVASISMADLKKKLSPVPPPIFTRYHENPILRPDRTLAWESKAVFNAGVLYTDKKFNLLYRAMSNDNTSVIGFAASIDGYTITERWPDPVYRPRAIFESKLNPGGNSGCEDPRLTKLGNRVYMLYTAFDGRNPPRVAMTSILHKDFVARQWRWTRPILISPPGVDDKDAAIFPEKINGKYAFFHRLGGDIWIDFKDDLEFSGDNWLNGKVILRPNHDETRIGIAGPPLKIKDGWLVIIHALTKKGHYNLGAILLSKKDPTIILHRTKLPILTVEMPYEKEGQVSNVVFSNGAAIVNQKIFIYYGGADKVLCLATGSLKELIKKLKEK